MTTSGGGGGWGVLIHFSVRERAAEQGIIFRIPTPGQGPYLSFFTLKGRLGYLHSVNVIQIAWTAIFPHF